MLLMLISGVQSGFVSGEKQGGFGLGVQVPKNVFKA